MANKKYYWLKLQRDFFKRHDIRIIEDMPNGKDYILFYLKLLVESIDHNGELRFNETIPYDEKMLSIITNTDIDKVKTAMKVFKTLNMIEIFDDSTIYMLEVDKMLGCETPWAEKKRNYREKTRTLSLSCPTDVRQEIDIEKDIDKEKEIDTPITPKKESQVDMANRLMDGTNISNELRDAVITWIEYKVQKKSKYVEKGMTSLITKIANYEQRYGTNKVCDLIDLSMSNNWQGIVWDKLDGSNDKISNRVSEVDNWV